MADFPNLLQFPVAGTISNLASAVSMASDMPSISGQSVGGGAWPANNRAIFVAFLVEQTVTAYQMGFEVTVQSGNYDIGIYDSLGNLLVSTGSTVVPVAGIATADIANTTLTPGLYYMALNISTTAASVLRQSTGPALICQVCGVRQQAVGAVTLPNPATFANPASSYCPYISVSLVSTL